MERERGQGWVMMMGLRRAWKPCNWKWFLMMPRCRRWMCPCQVPSASLSPSLSLSLSLSLSVCILRSVSFSPYFSVSLCVAVSPFLCLSVRRACKVLSSLFITYTHITLLPHSITRSSHTFYLSLPQPRSL
jgi:hypothetical protein